MIWTKRGHVYAPDGTRSWARVNASFPTALLEHDRLRVFYCSLDDEQIGRTAFLDLDPEDPARIIGESGAPILDVGAPGLFDDCGANVFSVLNDGGTTYLYYQGWQRTEKIPYLIFSGLATGPAGGTVFQKRSRTPMLDRCEDDPFLRGAPFVVKVGETFRMWYVSASDWIDDEHGMNYRVGIRHAVSEDGFSWTCDPGLCLAPDLEQEYGVGRPSLIVVDGTYHMWYSIRSFHRPYRLGYAWSRDGRGWTRADDLADIPRSADGWDSEMVCYANVVRVEDRLVLLYNGNRHGATGFGWAEATVEDLSAHAR